MMREVARMETKRRWMRWPCGILAVLLVLISGTACGRAEPPRAAAEVLSSLLAAMQKTAQVIPEGKVYDRSRSEDEAGYLSDTLVAALYGRAMADLMRPTAESGGAAPVSDAAMFLSMTEHPCELAVFRCSDARAAATAAKLCRARLEVIRNARADTEWAAVTERAVVTVEGSYVYLIVAEDPPSGFS